MKELFGLVPSGMYAQAMKAVLEFSIFIALFFGLLAIVSVI